jgi:hypothetical protein
MLTTINYVARSDDRPRYFANDVSRDTVVIDARMMPVTDVRGDAARLDREGFVRVDHRSAVADFADGGAVDAIHRGEIAALIARLSGADHVAVPSGGVLRFAERSTLSGALDNSRPARFAHVDVSDATAAAFAERSAPPARAIRRFAHFNIWRAISAPPQDVPLALCDARSFDRADLLPADAMFDRPGEPLWSFEGLVFAPGAGHRWCWFSGLDRDQAIIFKTHDSDPGQPHCVPHVAFDNPDCPADTPPRASIEMRAIAYWFAA